MAKRKTNVRNKAAALGADPREDMYKGKDRVTTAEEEETETEDTDIKATMEATPEVEGFIDSTQPENKEEPVQEDEGKYKKRYDDLKKYYDQKLSEWKQEKETLEAQKSAIEEPRNKYAPPKTPEELDRFRDQYPDVYQVVETISHNMAAKQVEDLQAEIGRLTEKEK